MLARHAAIEIEPLNFKLIAKSHSEHVGIVNFYLLSGFSRPNAGSSESMGGAAGSHI